MGFKKGNKHAGSRKGIPNKRTELQNALKYVEGTKGEDGKKRGKLLVSAVKRAYESDTLMVAIMRKLFPDMKTLEVEGGLTVEHELSDGLKTVLDQVYKGKE